MSHERVVVSTLLDATRHDPYAAAVFVRSVTTLAGIAVQDVVVDCAAGSDESVIASLCELGCRYTTRDPDIASGTPDDLLQQLEARCREGDRGASGFWLCAPGIAATAALPHADARGVRAILREDGLPALDLLYVSATVAGTLAEAWRRFMPAAADSPQHALLRAVQTTQIPLGPLMANDVVTVDATTAAPAYEPRTIVRMVRIPSFDAFGLVALTGHGSALDDALARLNAALADRSMTGAFGCFKRRRARRACDAVLAEADAADAVPAGLRGVAGKRMRLVLHAGTPKTATTALQQGLYHHAADLAERGIWYPTDDVDPVQKKQQYLVDLLAAGDAGELMRRLERAVVAAPARTHTIVMSTEGIFNHWWDYPARGKAMLRALTSAFDVEVWVCFRNPLAFAVSQHAQLLRNPRVFSPAYGRDASLDEMLDDAWFVQRLDYAGFVYEAEELLGRGSVRLFRYGPDIVPRIVAALGAPPFPVPGDVHTSLHAPGAELMRVVNRYALPVELQNRASALVGEIDRLIGDRAEPLRASAGAQQRIAALTARGWALIDADDARSRRGFVK